MTEGIYIAGKISGDEPAANAEKFKKAEAELKAMGYRFIVNPIKTVPTIFHNDWESCMRVCIAKMVSQCSAIYMLKDWKQSKGAQLEFLIASGLHFKIIMQGENG